jgi:Tfp pilus assembly protein PilO
MIAKSEALLRSVGVSNVSKWSHLNKIIIFTLIFLGYPMIIVMMGSVYLIRRRLEGKMKTE